MGNTKATRCCRQTTWSSTTRASSVPLKFKIETNSWKRGSIGSIAIIRGSIAIIRGRPSTSLNACIFVILEKDCICVKMLITHSKSASDLSMHLRVIFPTLWISHLLILFLCIYPCAVVMTKWPCLAVWCHALCLPFIPFSKLAVCLLHPCTSTFSAVVLFAFLANRNGLCGYLYSW